MEAMTRPLILSLCLALAGASASCSGEDRAVVHVYRHRSFFGLASGAVYEVHDGERSLGLLEPGLCLRYEAEPGEHEFWAFREVRSAVRLHLEPGSETFLRGSWAMGVVESRPELFVVEPEEGRRELTRDVDRIVEID